MTDILANPHSPERDATGRVVAAVDWRGNRFRLGDQVLYCLSQGNSYVMAQGTVTAIYSVLRETSRLRDPAPGETPNWVNDTVEPALALVRYTDFYDDVTVQVRTLKTASPHDPGPRTKPGWVKAENVTALDQENPA